MVLIRVVTLQILHYEKGHQGLNPGGHNFVFLNVSIKKKPFFVSQVVTFKNPQRDQE
jgi:hypothetical protein